MYHIALDRAGTYDRHLNDEIVKLARLQARQHVHLRAAFHLEDAQAVPLYQHVVNTGIFARDGRQRQITIMMIAQQVETLLQTGQHPQRQNVDLQNAQGFYIVFVPFDETAIRHGTIADWHGFDQRALGEDETAYVLRKMARHANHLLSQLQNTAQVRITHIEPGFLRMLFCNFSPIAAPDGPREHARGIFGQSHNLTDFANGHTRAVMNYCCAQPGAVTTVAIINMLDDLLAPFVFEIDVYIRWLLALFGDEAVEQQFVLVRVDSRNAKTVADGGVCRAAASLAQDRRIPGPRKIDDVPDGQEVACDAEPTDQIELIIDQACYLGRNTTRVTGLCALPGQFGKIRIRRTALGDRLVRVFITQFLKVECARIGHVTCCGNGMGPFGKQVDHFFRRFEVTFRICLKQKARTIDRRLFADAGHHILQGPPVAGVIVHVIGGKDGKAGASCQRIELVDTRNVVARVEIGGGKMPECRQLYGKLAQFSHKPLVENVRGDKDQLYAFCVVGQHCEVDVRLALVLPFPFQSLHLAPGQQ